MKDGTCNNIYCQDDLKDGDKSLIWNGDQRLF